MKVPISTRSALTSTPLISPTALRIAPLASSDFAISAALVAPDIISPISFSAQFVVRLVGELDGFHQPSRLPNKHQIFAGLDAPTHGLQNLEATFLQLLFEPVAMVA